jgi:hypothetical protein
MAAPKMTAKKDAVEISTVGMIRARSQTGPCLRWRWPWGAVPGCQLTTPP